MGVFRSAYDGVNDIASYTTALHCLDPSLAVQSEKDEADINTIVKRFRVTGELPQSVRAPTFADFTDVFDFQSAQNALIEARESFMAMPADVRKRFNNDPQLFVEFCSDGENVEEMRKLGLVDPVPVVPEVVPMKVEVVNPPVVEADDS